MSPKYVLTALAALGAVIAVAALGPLYRTGTFPPPSAAHVANFERLWGALEAYYPYFELKGLEPGELRARYLPRVEAARSDEEYCGIIADMLAEFGDAHTGVISPPAHTGRVYFGTCRMVEGKAVVDVVGETGLAAGLERGAIVLAVDGLPVEEAIAAFPPRLRSGSTPRQRWARAAFHLLSTPRTSLQVMFQGLGGEVRTAGLILPKSASAGVTRVGEDEEDPLITGELLPSGLGVIRIPTFSRGSGHDLVAEFDAALEALMDAPGLILDLRGNGGGSTALADGWRGGSWPRRSSTDGSIIGGASPSGAGGCTSITGWAPGARSTTGRWCCWRTSSP
jgi:carboxyl-terminal processing protease